MNCSVKAVIIFTISCLLYGSSFALAAKGLQYFSAGLYQSLRMFVGLIFTLCVIGVYCIFKKEYRQIFISHFTYGWKPILYLLFVGLINLGLPNCLISVGQKWVSSSEVQLMQPFMTASGAVFAHFILPDEPFTWNKFWSVVLSLIGVVLSAIPAFINSESAGSTVGQTLLGWVLVIISTIMYGFATVFYRWKVPKTDVTIGVAVQLFAALICDVIWMLIFDGPANIKKMIIEAPLIAWLYPILVGVFISGVAIQCFMWVVANLGTFGSNLIPFGQIIIGVIIGVAFLKEWALYSWWEIMLCIFGILFLMGSLVMGFLDKTPLAVTEIEPENVPTIVPTITPAILPGENIEEEEKSTDEEHAMIHEIPEL